MKLNEIQELWEKDALIDRENLIGESLKIPMLHSKYYNLYLVEKKLLLEHQEKYKKYEYYKSLHVQGKLSKEELDMWGWEQIDLKILKSDAHKAVDAQDDIIDYKLKIHNQQEKVSFLDNIIRTINNRSFITGSAMEHLRFEAGIN